MKSFICIFVLIASAYGLLDHSAIETIQKHQNDCDKETGVTFDRIAHAREHLELNSNGVMDKFAVCMLKKYNIMKSDGSINQERNIQDLITDDPEAFEKTASCRKINSKTNKLSIKWKFPQTIPLHFTHIYSNYQFQMFHDDGQDMYETARKVMNCYMKKDILLLDPSPVKHCH